MVTKSTSTDTCVRPTYTSNGATRPPTPPLHSQRMRYYTAQSTIVALLEIQAHSTFSAHNRPSHYASERAGISKPKDSRLRYVSHVPIDPIPYNSLTFPPFVSRVCAVRLRAITISNTLNTAATTPTQTTTISTICTAHHQCCTPSAQVLKLYAHSPCSGTYHAVSRPPEPEYAPIMLRRVTSRSEGEPAAEDPVNELVRLARHSRRALSVSASSPPELTSAR